MDIIGLQVIRGGVALEAIPPEKIELTYGDSLRVSVSLEYKGSKLDATLYGAIGVRYWPDFEEKVFGNADAHFSKSDTFTPWSGSVDIPITSDIDPGADYDLYCKLKEFPGAGMPEVDNIITITGIPPSYELLEETIYPYAYIYDGPCESGTFTFKTAPFTPASWIAGRFAEYCQAEVRKAGGRVLETRVYVNKTPLLWTEWQIEIVYVPPSATVAGIAMSLGFWGAIVGILLVILGLIALLLVGLYVWKQVAATFKRKPELEAVKVGWHKETLIMTIQDSEEYWERTPTPIETLEGMSEEELREYLDKIAEEEVPPVEGLGLALAAAGVLGLGVLALAAFAMGKPEETKKKK